MTGTRPEDLSHGPLENPRRPDTLYTVFWSIQAKKEGPLEAQKTMGQDARSSGTCAYCGETFERKARGGPGKFCSGACRVAAWRQRQRLEQLNPFETAGLVRSNGHGPELVDPLVSLAFTPEPWRWFRVGGNGSSRLESVPWFEWWLAGIGYDLRDGSPLEGAPLRLPPGPERKAAAAA
jgi:hypothetical protein